MQGKMKEDIYFMGKALLEAKKAWKKGEVPVGSIIVSGSQIIGRGYNQLISKNNPTAHAEVIALQQACKKKGNYRLSDCDLYVTLEPCAMCLGAIILARIRRLVFAAYDPKAGAVESIMKFPFEKMNHRPKIQGGVLAEECGMLLKEFFKNKRKKSAEMAF